MSNHPHFSCRQKRSRIQVSIGDLKFCQMSPKVIGIFYSFLKSKKRRKSRLVRNLSKNMAQDAESPVSVSSSTLVSLEDVSSNLDITLSSPEVNSNSTSSASSSSEFDDFLLSQGLLDPFPTTLNGILQLHQFLSILQDPSTPAGFQLQSLARSLAIDQNLCFLGALENAHHSIQVLFLRMLSTRRLGVPVPKLISLLALVVRFHGLSKAGFDILHATLQFPIYRTCRRLEKGIARNMVGFLTTPKQNRIGVLCFDNHQVISRSNVVSGLSSVTRFKVILVGQGAIVPDHILHSDKLILHPPSRLSVKNCFTLSHRFPSLDSHWKKSIRQFDLQLLSISAILDDKQTFRSLKGLTLADFESSKMSSVLASFRSLAPSFPSSILTLKSDVMLPATSNSASDLSNRLLPLRPVFEQPSKNSCLQMIQLNSPSFCKATTTIFSIGDENPEFNSWLGYNPGLRVLFRARCNSPISFSEFRSKFDVPLKHPHKCESSVFLDKHFGSATARKEFIQQIAKPKSTGPTVTRPSCVVVGVDQLIYKWLTKSPPTNFYPWLGEFHLLYNVARLFHTILSSSDFGNHLLSLLHIRLGEHHQVLPISGNYMERSINSMFCIACGIALFIEKYPKLIDDMNIFNRHLSHLLKFLADLGQSCRYLLFAVKSHDFLVYIEAYRRILYLIFHCDKHMWGYKHSMLLHFINLLRLGPTWGKFFISISTTTVKSCKICEPGDLTMPCDWGNEDFIRRLNHLCRSGSDVDSVEEISDISFTYGILRPILSDFTSKTPQRVLLSHTYSSIFVLCVFLHLRTVFKSSDIHSPVKFKFLDKNDARFRVSTYWIATVNRTFDSIRKKWKALHKPLDIDE